jgi:hypothetical protein
MNANGTLVTLIQLDGKNFVLAFQHSNNTAFF